MRRDSVPARLTGTWQHGMWGSIGMEHRAHLRSAAARRAGSAHGDWRHGRGGGAGMRGRAAARARRQPHGQLWRARVRAQVGAAQRGRRSRAGAWLLQRPVRVLAWRADRGMVRKQRRPLYRVTLDVPHRRTACRRQRVRLPERRAARQRDERAGARRARAGRPGVQGARQRRARARAAAQQRGGGGGRTLGQTLSQTLSQTLARGQQLQLPRRRRGHGAAARERRAALRRGAARRGLRAAAARQACARSHAACYQAPGELRGSALAMLPHRLVRRNLFYPGAH